VLNKYFILFLWAACAQWPLHAQVIATTQGTEFWFGFMKNYDQDAGEELRVLISSRQATNGVVLVPGQNYAQSFNVAANSTTTVIIPNSIGEMSTVNQIENRGIQVLSQDSVSVFAYNFNPYTGDAARILPIEALGISYIASSYTGLAGYESEMLVVATADQTAIEITPSTALVGGYTAGLPFNVVLSEGECIQLRTLVGGDLTGTRINGTNESGSCRTFAVFSGTDCANITPECGLCDHLFEQNYPLPSWGNVYYLAPWQYITPAVTTWRLLASQNNTTITIDGSSVYNLNSGQYIEFNQDALAHCIVADAPIAAVQYMESLGCVGNGDPSMLILDDESKQLNQVSFATLSSLVVVDHYLNLVIEAEDLGQVFLDGIQINPNLFEYFADCSEMMWCGIEISNGNHVLEILSGSLSGYVYGVGDGESYAYSLGSTHPYEPPIPDDYLCSDLTITLQMDAALTNATWAMAIEPDTVLFHGNTWTLNAPFDAGQYLGTGVDPLSGCPVTTIIEVESPVIPNYTITPAQTICRAETVQLALSLESEYGTYLYQWSPESHLNNSHIANPTAAPLESTTYVCSIITPSGCATLTDSVTISVAPGGISSMELNYSDTSICQGASLDLNVITEAIIWDDNFDPNIAWGSWEDITNGSANSVCGAVSNQALYFNGNITREAITTPLNVLSGGHIDFYLKIADGTSPCEDADPGDHVVLSYSVNNGLWITIQTYYESNYPVFTAISQSIPLGAYSANTRFKWSQIGLWLNNQDNWVLDNVEISSIQTDNYGYDWSPQANLVQIGSSNVTVTPGSSTWYYVEMSDATFGCTYTDSIFIQVDTPINVEVMDQIALCTSEGVQLDTQLPNYQGLSYTWSPLVYIDNPFIDQPTVSPPTNTTYSVEIISEGGCSATADIDVLVAILDNLTLTTNDSTICPGESIELASSFESDVLGLTFQWSPATSLTSPQNISTAASPNQTTNYALEITYEDLCVWQENINITVVPTFEIVANVDTISGCSNIGSIVSAQANTDDPLIWTWTPANLVTAPDESATSILVNTTETLTIQAINSAGCTAQDSIALEFLTFTIDWPELIEICEDSLLFLDTELPSSYAFNWNVDFDESSLFVAESGTYEVEAISAEGCISTASTEVIFYDFPPMPNFVDTSFCEGQTMTLDAYVGNFHYQWQDGSESNTYDIVTTGVYEVSIDNGFCFTTAASQVNVYAGPEKPFTDELIEICMEYPPYQVLLNAENEGMSYCGIQDR